MRVPGVGRTIATAIREAVGPEQPAKLRVRVEPRTEPAPDGETGSLREQSDWSRVGSAEPSRALALTGCRRARPAAGEPRLRVSILRGSPRPRACVCASAAMVTHLQTNVTAGEVGTGARRGVPSVHLHVSGANVPDRSGVGQDKGRDTRPCAPCPLRGARMACGGERRVTGAHCDDRSGSLNWGVRHGAQTIPGGHAQAGHRGGRPRRVKVCCGLLVETALSHL